MHPGFPIMNVLSGILSRVEPCYYFKWKLLGNFKRVVKNIPQSGNLPSC